MGRDTNGDDDFIAGFIDDYFAECDEHFTTVRPLLLTLEGALGRGAVDPGILDELFQVFHSLKGISGMVELREAEMLAHEMESYLRALRQRETTFSQAGVDALIGGVDALERVVAARRGNRASPPVSSAMRAIAAVVPAPSASPSATVPGGAAAVFAPWIVTFTPSAALNARGLNVDTVRARLRERGTILHAAPKILDTGIAFEFGFAGDLDDETLAAWPADGLIAARSVPPPAVEAGDAAPDGPAEPLPSAASHYVRVDLAKLDELMRMIGDLVISRARLGDTLARIERRVPPVEWRAVQENSAAIERQLRDLREGVMRVRLVPVGEIFRRMPFVVRDLAQGLDRRRCASCSRGRKPRSTSS